MKYERDVLLLEIAVITVVVAIALLTAQWIIDWLT